MCQTCQQANSAGPQFYCPLCHYFAIPNLLSTGLQHQNPLHGVIMFNLQCKKKKKKLNSLSGYISESQPFLDVSQLNHMQLRFLSRIPGNF